MKSSIYFFVFVCSNIVFTQNLTISNQLHIGGSGDDNVQLVDIPNSTNKFIIGSSNSPISGNKTDTCRGGADIWVVKTDENLNVLWDKTIGGVNDDTPSDYYFDEYKLYIFGTSLSGISGDKTSASYGSVDYWLICMDTIGTILWQKNYGGASADNAGNMISASDTSLFVIGTSYSEISGNKTVASYGGDDFWLLEISKETGAIIQQKSYGSTTDDDTPIIKYNPDNHNYYIVGTTYSNLSSDGIKTDAGYGMTDTWIVRLDENLNVIQDKCFGGTSYDYFNLKLVIANNSIYFLNLSKSSNTGNKSEPNFSLAGLNSDLWIVKVDYDLNIIWDKVYGGTSDESGNILIQGNTGNWVVICNSNSVASGNKTAPRYGTNYDLWALILDDNGAILAQESYGGTQEDYGGAILKSESELYMYSSSYSGSDGNKTVPSYGGSDGWFATIDASDFLSTTSLNASNESVAVYPNPFTTEVNFKFRNVNEKLQLIFYSLDGRLLDEVSIDPSINNVYSYKPSSGESIILYSIIGEKISYNGKLVR